MSDKEIILGYLEFERGHYTHQDERDVDTYLLENARAQNPHPLYWEQNHTFEA